MKTWEMIKALSENPGKIFKNQRDETIKVLPDDDLFFDGEDGHNYISITDEWTEVKEPVDFMTAYMAFEEDGKIVVWLPDNYPHSPKKRFDGKTQNRDDFEVTGV